MEITAKMIEILPFQSGNSKNGEWKKQDFIVETIGQYPKKILFNIWGDKFEIKDNMIGKEVKIYFDIESRSFNERWFTDLKVWKMELVDSKADDENSSVFSSDSNTDILPF